MSGGPLSIVLDGERREPAEDIAMGPAWLRHVVAERQDPQLRIYQPAAAVAFSGRDCLLPGIHDAVRSADDLHYSAVRRGTGGHAAAYHRGCLGIDHVSRGGLEPDSIRGRFQLYGELLAGALRTLGVGAEVGEVPGEYCPGEFSVNDGHGRKLIGTAQRLVPGGWLFSSMIVVNRSAELVGVLGGVYRDLGLALVESTVGAVEDASPGVTVDDVERAIIKAYGAVEDYRFAEVPGAVVGSARAARARHMIR